MGADLGQRYIMDIKPETIISDVQKTEVQHFFSGTNIFITGGTGFIGKLLIEKLLRTCPDINAIYLLIREKKGKNMQSRVTEIFDDIVYSKLRESNPKFQDKIHGIAGDISLPELAISKENQKLLMSETNVVFHVAATVKFHEQLRVAAHINVRGTQELIKLCKGMGKLKSLVHVSTAYSHCPRDPISERFYDPPITPGKLFSLLEAADDKLLDDIEKRVVGDWPNTYTYTKAVAEEVIRTEGFDLPVAIFRPSIVSSAYKEPFRGWVDNMYGTAGICAGAITGVLRSLHCNKNQEAQVIPVDWCVNSLICCAKDVMDFERRHLRDGRDKAESDIPIYNYVSPKDNIMNWQSFTSLCAEYGLQYPPLKTMWYYCMTLNRFWLIHWLYVIIFQYFPAVVIDGAMLCVGKKSQMLKISQRVTYYTEILSYFNSKSWFFENTNVRALWGKLNKNDKELFAFNISELNWDEYCRNYVKGVKLYLFKESMKTLPEAQARWRKLYWLHQMVKFTIYFLMLRFLWYISSNLYQMFNVH